MSELTLDKFSYSQLTIFITDATVQLRHETQRCRFSTFSDDIFWWHH